MSESGVTGAEIVAPECEGDCCEPDVQFDDSRAERWPLDSAWRLGLGLDGEMCLVVPGARVDLGAVKEKEGDETDDPSGMLRGSVL